MYKDNGVEITTFPKEIGNDYVATLVVKAGSTNYKQGGKVKATYSIVKPTFESAVINFENGNGFDSTTNSFSYDASKGQVPVVDSVLLNGADDIASDCNIEYPKAADSKDVGTYTV